MVEGQHCDGSIMGSLWVFGMTPFPPSETYWPDPILSPIAARDWFVNRIALREPASLIRIGDAEMGMLGYAAEAPWSQTALFLQGQFGRSEFEPATLARLAQRLRAAVRAASMVGLPRPSRQLRDPYFGFVADLYKNYGLRAPGQIFTDCAIQRFWQMLLAFRPLISGLPFVGVVTSRNLSAQIAQTFGIDKVTLYPVPSQRRALGAYEDIGPHFPDRFEQLCGELTVPYRGAVFIVGAGILGKIYAHLIHQRGGIAIDVGSVLDGWANVPSRAFLQRTPDLFGLDVYKETAHLSAVEIVERYEHLVRSEYFANPPTEEEFAFYLRRNGNLTPAPLRVREARPPDY